MESFGDIHTTWQNSKNVLDDLKKDNDARAAYMNGQLIGYVIYNPKSKQIQQIAIHKSYRRKGIATKLIADLAGQYGSSFSVINVDKKAKSLSDFFESLGFECFIEQLEMELILNKN